MITKEDIKQKLKTAVYEVLEDDGTFYGEIPSCPGVWANADTLKGCKSELSEILEEWIGWYLEDGEEVPGFSSAINSKSLRGLSRDYAKEHIT